MIANPFILNASTTADETPGLCQKANDLGKAKKYTDALKLYQETLLKHPNNLDCLYDAGMTAYLAKQFSAALTFWNQYKKLSPTDWIVYSKLIQTYQALGKTKERDQERQELLVLRAHNKKTNQDQAFAKVPQFCREQLEVDGKMVMAYERFEPIENQDDFAQRYRFIVYKPGTETPDFLISLGSYNQINKYAHESNQLKAGERLFHLDGYYDGDRVHKTFQFFPKEPSYEEVRKLLIAIVQNKLPAISGTEKKLDASK